MSNFTKLSILMFFQFFIWGSWYTSVSQFMAEEGMSKDIYWVYTAGPLAAIIAPFFLGLFADRFFNTEKIHEEVVSIPISPVMTVGQVTTIISILNSY